jgi:hypothetical protein
MREARFAGGRAMAELEVIAEAKDVLEVLGDNLAQFNSDFTTTMVSLLDGYILLKHYDELCNASYTQMFTCDLSDILDKKAMAAAFPNRDAVRAAALEHTKGRVNKEAFMRNLESLKLSQVVNDYDYAVLSALIKDSSCPPVRLIEKLSKLGYGDIIVKLDFYEEDPLLTRSVLAFEQFMSLLWRQS